MKKRTKKQPKRQPLNTTPQPWTISRFEELKHHIVRVEPCGETTIGLALDTDVPPEEAEANAVLMSLSPILWQAFVNLLRVTEDECDCEDCDPTGVLAQYRELYRVASRIINVTGTK